MRRRHELPFGAELVPEGVRFRLWASRAATVAVEIDGAATVAMAAEGAGWFATTLARCGSGTRYRYVVDGARVPDPAARYQPDGVHGPSEVVDPGAYDWQDHAWAGRAWEEIVIYELHLGTFSQSGDFAGAIAHLDHVRALGATAVELMPVAEFPGARNWGYDGVFLFAPSRAYGRPEALKALVDAAHARGLAVLLDVVYNHFGPEGNYLPAIAPDYFTERHHTPWGAAIDYEGPHSRPVRDFVIENALYWLTEFHIDGLRLDAVHAIIDESEPDIVAEIAREARRRVTGRPVHLVVENERNEAHRLTRHEGRAVHYDAQWNDDVHHVLHVLLTGETGGYYVDYAELPAARLGRTLASGFGYQGEGSRLRDGRSRGEPSGELPPTAFIAFLQNHDQIGNNAFGKRILPRTTEPLLHAAVASVLLGPQIPLLFMGEEWGTERPFAFFCDFEPPLADAVREGRRREFAHFPEFRDEAALARIPDPTAPSTFEASRLDWDEPATGGRAVWLARYRELLAIRAREIVPRLSGMAPFSGNYQVLGPKAVRVEWHLGDGSGLVLLANFAETAVALDGAAERGSLLYAAGSPPTGDRLAPASAAVFLRTADPPAKGSA